MNTQRLMETSPRSTYSGCFAWGKINDWSTPFYGCREDALRGRRSHYPCLFFASRYPKTTIRLLKIIETHFRLKAKMRSEVDTGKDGPSPHTYLYVPVTQIRLSPFWRACKLRLSFLTAYLKGCHSGEISAAMLTHITQNTYFGQTRHATAKFLDGFTLPIGNRYAWVYNYADGRRQIPLRRPKTVGERKFFLKNDPKSSFTKKQRDRLKRWEQWSDI